MGRYQKNATTHLSRTYKKLDYGSEIFYTANKSALKRLDKIQTTCLKIICGAPQSATSDILLNECGELPLKLRRKIILLKHLAKIEQDPRNIANEVLESDWQSEYGRYTKNNCPVSKITREEHKIISQKSEFPPWASIEVNVDIKLAQLVNKQADSPERTKQCTLEHMQKYLDSVHIFTDGSKLSDSSTGCALYIRNSNQFKSYKLPNHCSIYTAENYAILKTLEWINNFANSKGPFTIFSVSLNALQSLEKINLHHQNELLQNILKELIKINANGILLTLVWIPSHINITGNEKADRLAKEAARGNQNEVNLPKTLPDIYVQILENALKEWQDIYTANNKGCFYKTIEPAVSLKIKYQNNNRRKEQFLTKFRFGLTLLNDRKFKYGIKDNNLCENCHSKPETIQHVLFDCQSYPIFHKNKNIKELLTNMSNLDTIYEYFLLNNRIGNI